MYSVEIEYLGNIYSKINLTKAAALEMAENAVYKTGADWSCVYDEHMEIYCEYEQ